MIHKAVFPKDVEERLRSLGPALQQCSGVLFAYLFGGATVSPLKPLSDVDVAVYLDNSIDLVEGRLEAISVVTTHLQTTRWTWSSMRRTPREEGARWLQQAVEDLRWAENLAERGGYHIACFLAQQIGEKAVKAFLCSTSSMPMTTSSNRTVASMYEFPWARTVAGSLLEELGYDV